MLKILLTLIFSISLQVLADRTVCKTPNNNDGYCVSFQSCESLRKLFRNSSPEDKEFVRQSDCGRTPTGGLLVCCQDDFVQTITTEVTPAVKVESNPRIDDSCVTPENLPGTCQSFKSCSYLFEIFKNKPVSPKNQQLIRDSKCRYENGAIIVCCPEKKIVLVEPKQEPEDPDACDTPDELRGTCVPFMKCPEMGALYGNPSRTEKDEDFIQASICGEEDGNTYVCCKKPSIIKNTRKPLITATSTTPKPSTTTPKPTTTTTPEPKTTSTTTEDPTPAWLKKLKDFLPTAPNCGIDSPDRIFGGTEAKISEFPWTVLLEFTKGNGPTTFGCGGSLINNRYVLTAAHCLKKGQMFNSARIGEHRISTLKDCDVDDKTFCNPRIISNKIVRITEHPNFRHNSKNYQYDIALLRLAQRVDIKKYIPICLPLDPSLWNMDYSGHSFEAAGWGRVVDSNATGSDVKLKVDLPFVPQKTCQSKLSRHGYTLIESQFCAGGEEGKDTCQGDSGGPLMKYKEDATLPYWYLAGVVSYGGKCGEGLPGVYTNVAPFLQWISENIYK